MLQITPQQKLIIAINPIDFRGGIDAIAAVCRQQLDENPLSGAVFVFRNRKRTGVKMLIYDGQGFWLCFKRFSRGKLSWWPTANTNTFNASASQLQILLYQGNPTFAKIPADWQPINK
jgi:transposase